MAGQFTRLQKTYRIIDEDGVKLYTGVVFAGENSCKKPDADNMTPLGVVDNDERIDDPMRAGGNQAGKNVAVKLEGIASITCAANVEAGDRVILADGGHVKPVAETSGAYHVLGFAEKDGEEGDVIPVRMAYHVYTVE